MRMNESPDDIRLGTMVNSVLRKPVMPVELDSLLISNELLREEFKLTVGAYKLAKLALLRIGEYKIEKIINPIKNIKSDSLLRKDLKESVYT
ncbi:MAG: hypothetical protein QXS81_03525 [Candidatus Micrarchaeaceae archaeon]